MANPLILSEYEPFSGLERARRRLREAVAAATLKPREPSEPRAGFASRVYQEIDVEFDAAQSAGWCWLKPREAPSFTPDLLADLQRQRAAVHELFAQLPAGAPPPLTHLVVGSRLPGIFNLGGDLACFGRWIRTRDREGLRAYAYSCIEILHDNAIGFGRSVLTIALVQGDALGGGFETALSCHMIVAERGVKFGMPEILFNLFPGMGALSLLSRRVGLAQAERMVTSGQIYTAEDLHEMGVVQVLAAPGEGVSETHSLIARSMRRRSALSAIRQASQRISPLPYAELRDIVDIWVEAALMLDETDLRKMERLKVAQERRMSAGANLAAG